MEDHLWDILLGVDFQLLEKDGYERQVRGDDIVILAHLHCLTSIKRFFEVLTDQDLSIPCRQIILIPKLYSTIPSVEASLRKTGIVVASDIPSFKPGYYDKSASQTLKSGCRSAVSACNDIIKKGRKPRLVLVDDGGMLTETWWRHFRTRDFDVVSVQQTASGTRRYPPPAEVAKIDVARSAAKRHFEAKIIAAGVLKKVADLDVLKASKRIGIVGVGALGGALAEDLASQGRHVNLYDLKRDYSKPRKSARYLKLPLLLNDCDLVFGCTGRNFLKLSLLQRIRENHSIQFVSCSSRDTEFLDLLRFGEINPQTVCGGYGRFEIRMPGTKPHFLENGGFPINFDRKVELEKPNEIALTRALVLAGIFQALCVKIKEPRKDLLKLSPSIQMALVRQWLQMTGKHATEFGVTADIDSLEWWEKFSSGELPVLSRSSRTMTPQRPSGLKPEAALSAQVLVR